MALLELTPNLLWFGQIKSATHSWRKKPTYRYAVSEIGLARIGSLSTFVGKKGLGGTRCVAGLRITQSRALSVSPRLNQ